MSRDDLKDLGEALDAGMGGLLAVYEANLAGRIAATVKAANRGISKATDMAADQQRKAPAPQKEAKAPSAG